MALHDRHHFDDALSRFSAGLGERAHFLRNLIWERYPESNELIYIKDKYFAVGWGFSDKQTDIFVSVAVYTEHINLGFNFGHHVSDPHGLLQGSGSVYRYYRMGSDSAFPLSEIERFMDQGWTLAHAKLKPGLQLPQGQTILKQDTRKPR